jgi:hypothetical protein
MTEAKVVKAEEKAKFGRPSEYKEEYCEKVIELMKDGASKAEVCLELSCAFQTFLDWQKQNPNFLEAVKRGLHLSKGKWEQIGRKAAFGNVENFNATAWIFNMKNRFSKLDDFDERWTDKQELDHVHTVSRMSDSELDARIEALKNASSE